MRGNILIAVLLGAMAVDANAAHICWVDGVVMSGVGVEVRFSESSRQQLWINGIKRSGSENAHLLTREEQGVPLILNEGDAAGVRMGAHDSCELKAEKRDGVLGVVANATSAGLGLPAVHASDFITPDGAGN